jgi:hypothetical protein
MDQKLAVGQNRHINRAGSRKEGSPHLTRSTTLYNWRRGISVGNSVLLYKRLIVPHLKSTGKEATNGAVQVCLSCVMANRCFNNKQISLGVAGFCRPLRHNSPEAYTLQQRRP